MASPTLPFEIELAIANYATEYYWSQSDDSGLAVYAATAAEARSILVAAILAYGNELYLQGMHDRAESPYVGVPNG